MNILQLHYIIVNSPVGKNEYDDDVKNYLSFLFIRPKSKFYFYGKQV